MKNRTEDVRYWANRPKDDKRLDWRNGAGSWIDEYVASVAHPHRNLILESLRHFTDFQSILEVGCNAGPNLIRIREKFPKVALFGVDVNYDAIQRAKREIPEVNVETRSVEDLPFNDSTIDIVLADAVLMYISNIDKALSEMARVAKRGIIIIDWFAEEECIKDFHHARNYPKLLKDLGFETKIIKLREKEWPTSQNWVKNGRLFISHRVLQIGKKN